MRAAPCTHHASSGHSFRPATASLPRSALDLVAMHASPVTQHPSPRIHHASWNVEPADAGTGNRRPGEMMRSSRCVLRGERCICSTVHVPCLRPGLSDAGVVLRMAPSRTLRPRSRNRSSPIQSFSAAARPGSRCTHHQSRSTHHPYSPRTVHVRLHVRRRVHFSAGRFTK